jgi:uncharacterized protein (TIGR02996 family)
MSDGPALKATIWDRPTDDAARLVYADWLDEHGDESRAEFVRVQVRAARLSKWDDARPALDTRAKALHAEHGPAWRAELPERWREKAEFHRGFPVIQLQKLSRHELLNLTPDDLSAAPLARYHYDFRGSKLAEHLDWPCAHKLEMFSPRRPVPDDWAERVAACDALRNVWQLCAIDLDLTPRRINVLLGAWANRALPVLWFAGPMGDDGAEALAAHPTGAQLRELDLRGTKFTHIGMRHLNRSPHLRNVRDLDLGYADVGDAAVTELARGPFLSGLYSLNLTNNKLTDRAAYALADSPAAANLRALYFGDAKLGVAAVRALARSPHLGNLKKLGAGDGAGARDEKVKAEVNARFGPTALL